MIRTNKNSVETSCYHTWVHKLPKFSNRNTEQDCNKTYKKINLMKKIIEMFNYWGKTGLGVVSAT